MASSACAGLGATKRSSASVNDGASNLMASVLAFFKSGTVHRPSKHAQCETRAIPHITLIEPESRPVEVAIKLPRHYEMIRAIDCALEQLQRFFARDFAMSLISSVE